MRDFSRRGFLAVACGALASPVSPRQCSGPAFTAGGVRSVQGPCAVGVGPEAVVVLDEQLRVAREFGWTYDAIRGMPEAFAAVVREAGNQRRRSDMRSRG